MTKYILSIDQGTTSCRAVLFDKKGNSVGVAQKEFSQYFPKSGWVEHDAIEIWETQLKVIINVVARVKVSFKEIASIGITNQRETIVVWNKHTGKPIHNAIVWQDKRTSKFCNDLKTAGKQKLIKEKTGLVIDPYFSGTKIKWILDNVKGARKDAEKGDLLVGTIDSWLIWKLTKGRHFITDVTNASRTLLFNINSLQWDDELLEVFSIPKKMLPEVKQSSEVYGVTSSDIFGQEIVISGIAGDQQAALFGQLCTQKGMVKNTYGTGCFMLMNIGEKPITSKNNLLTTVAWKINNKVTYAIEGSVFIAGAAVQWLRDGLKIIEYSSDIEDLSKEVEDSDSVYFVPSFAGLGAPYWNQNAKGTLFGITRGTTDAHIAKATLEAIAFQSMDVLEAMQKDANTQIKELRVDGGATVNDYLMQFQADILKTKVIRPKQKESTALGAAFLAGLAVGFWRNQEELKVIWQSEKVFNFNKQARDIEKKIKGWSRAISAVEFWSKSSEN